MQIQFNTDHTIHGTEALAARVKAVVADALGSLSEQISRVEVHLSDQNGGKKGPDDKACVMEARLEGHQPIAVTHKADSIDEAVSGAAEKLSSTLERLVAKLRTRR